MRLLIAGNLANTGYYLVSKLKEYGIYVDLLMEKNPTFANDPRNTDELTNDQYPLWIKFWDWKKNWKFQIIKIMRKYDLISAATELPIFALFSLKPYIAIATGSDLFFLAKSKSLRGFLLRLAYRRARVVVYTLPSHRTNVELLKLKNAIFLPLFRNFNKSFVKVKKNYKEKFVFFHPTSHRWESKGNDLFLKAFMRLCKTRDDVFLILINRGEDAEKSIKLLKDANMDEKFEILPHTLSQDELYSYYNACDVVVDQFIVGSFGLTGLEVLNLGKPLVCFIDEEAYEMSYGLKPPVLSSNNEEGIFQILIKLLEDKQYCNEISEKSLNWFQKFHAEENLIKKYIELYTQVHEGKRYQEIFSNLKLNRN